MLNYSVDADGIATLEWDYPGKSQNILNTASLDANFTVDTGGGGWGKWDTAGDTWSHACGGGAPVNFCAKRAHVYCFEE